MARSLTVRCVVRGGLVSFMLVLVVVGALLLPPAVAQLTRSSEFGLLAYVLLAGLAAMSVWVAFARLAESALDGASGGRLVRPGKQEVRSVMRGMLGVHIALSVVSFLGGMFVRATALSQESGGVFGLAFMGLLGLVCAATYMLGVAILAAHRCGPLQAIGRGIGLLFGRPDIALSALWPTVAVNLLIGGAMYIVTSVSGSVFVLLLIVVLCLVAAGSLWHFGVAALAFKLSETFSPESQSPDLQPRGLVASRYTHARPRPIPGAPAAEDEPTVMMS